MADLITKTTPCLEQVWDALEKFIDPDTGMLYDNALGRAALPAREQVIKDIPNQCGWMSGFEDAALNSGFLLPYVIHLAQKTGEEKWQNAAFNLADLLLKLVTVSGTPGFVARGVLPDGRTYFRDSSTDQYTMAFRAMLAISQWEQAGEERKRKAARFAEDAMQLLQKHQWNIPTADGQKSWVGETSQFWPDRASRLLQFAAVNASLNPAEDSRALYRNLRDDCAGRRTRGLFSRPNYTTIPYALLQTQVSLCNLWKLETDDAYKTVWRNNMYDVAENTVLQLQALDMQTIIRRIDHLPNMPEPVSVMELYTDEDYSNRHQLTKIADLAGRYWQTNIRLHTEQEFIRQPLELALCFTLAENHELKDYNGMPLARVAEQYIDTILRTVRLEHIRFCHSLVSMFVAAIWLEEYRSQQNGDSN